MSDHVGKETAVTEHPEHQETEIINVPVRERELSVHRSEPSIDQSEPSSDTPSYVEPGDESQPSQRPAGDPRALLAARLLAALALAVSSVIHAKLAIQLGIGGSVLSQGQLFAATAVISALLAVAMLTSNKHVWLVAVVLSVSGLGAVLASVYLPVPQVGPFPSINEQEWFTTKVIAAFAEASVPVLWLIRSIAPPAETTQQDGEVADGPRVRSDAATTANPATV